MINGVINIYKEAGFTSHDVVAKLRGIVKQKKIGHTGTLDPAAEGVLPVCLGNATKLCDLITDWDKTYEAVMLLGRTTDTQDTTGATLQERPVTAGEEQVKEAVLSFLGDYDQIPPMYSALKVDGKKLYELAREGKEVERKARPVHIFELEILEMDLPRVRMRVTCSKGTYIRTLCHDIGEKLGCGGCMEKLLRTCVGIFPLEEALRLSQVQELALAEEVDLRQKQLKEGLGACLVSVEDIFPACGKLILKPEGDKLIYNGNPFTEHFVREKQQSEKAWMRVYDSTGHFVGIYQFVSKEHRYKPIKMFLEKES
ncbi:MAG: tRNA pseudouridine(55) synthase TruB [Lachnospiraceae bacterium]|nr:tRNA pseudouridine(55) synthase TruB [Lachnospiraceae bacterium]